MELNFSLSFEGGLKSNDYNGELVNGQSSAFQNQQRKPGQTK